MPILEPSTISSQETGPARPVQQVRGQVVGFGVQWPLIDKVQMATEVTKCAESAEYFISNFCYIDDKSNGDILKFDLWPDQKPILHSFITDKRVVVLKARQVGLTWLALCYALWLMLFKPGVTVLLFSLRDIEAIELLARVTRIYDRLPKFLRCKCKEKNDAHTLRLSNTSECKAFPTGKGDSYTAALAIFDEADVVDDKTQREMMLSIKPTVDAGGQLFLISKSDKKKPGSTFKQIYRSARAGVTSWKAAFLPWYSRPERTNEWYEQEKSDSFKTTGSFDSVYENYPESDKQALAPSSKDKRIPTEWLDIVLREQTPDESIIPSLKHIAGIRVYKKPVIGRKYVAGCDTSEGNPNSDPASIVVVDHKTGEEVCSLNFRLSPERLAQALDAMCMAYNKAPALIERNNHGHAVIMWMNANSLIRLLEGTDKKQGWCETHNSKTLIYDNGSERIRENECVIHSFDLYGQLSLIDGTDLSADEGHDDFAMAFMLSLKAIDLHRYGTFNDSDFDMSKVSDSSKHTPFGMSTNNSSPFGVVHK